MEYPRIIATEDVHRSRTDNQQPEVEKGLDKANFDLKNSIVRLQFDFGEGTKYGTGFFVNLPSNKYDVILTAAHNLINEKSVKALNLMVIYGEDDKEPVTEFKICPTYKGLLGSNSTDKGIYDYGIILFSKDSSRADKRQGLGLSLVLSSHATLQGSREARVSGYVLGDDGKVSLRHSSGLLMRFGKQLEYRASTEQGMSGSPVWIPYGGHPMVVAIHNMRAKNKGSGSRGTKITEEVFRNICLWTEMDIFGKRLCAPKSRNKSHNTYLSFSQHSDFAKVFLGLSEAASAQDNLTFDIVPATVFPKWDDKSPLYAFKFHKPQAWSDPEKCWVEWQPMRQRAVLVDILKDVNLVRLPEKNKTGKKRYSVVLPVPGNEAQNQELRLHDDDRAEDDIEDGMTEFAGVSFGLYMEHGVVGSRTFMIE